jgi:hypothetical protein
MILYYINADAGDGSSYTEFYDSQECIDYLCDTDNGFEQYWDGDGGSWGTIEITGEVVTKGKVRTMADILADRADY